MIPFLIICPVFLQPGSENKMRVWPLSEAGDGAESMLVCCGAQWDHVWVPSTLTSFTALYCEERTPPPCGIFAFFMNSHMEMVNSVLVAGARGIHVVITITEEDFP